MAEQGASAVDDKVDAEIKELTERHRQLVNIFVNRVDDKRLVLVSWRKLVYDMMVAETEFIGHILRQESDHHPDLRECYEGMKALQEIQRFAWDVSSNKLMDEVAADYAANLAVKKAVVVTAGTFAAATKAAAAATTTAEKEE